ncbi:MAG TPA: hypothetical protein VMK12_19425 [Anaeromyxobacteraceae bacterium]|nr:hypothetical protein [Anaeromyxobacteraceae bacterium]
MANPLLWDSRLMAEVLDAYPAPTVIVDDDMRILFASRAAREYLGLGGDAANSVFLQRGGQALRCLNAEVTAEGCGRAPACRDCMVRNSVQAVFETGTVQRAKAFLQLRSGAGIVDRFFLVSASAVRSEGRRVALLVLQDISELMQLKNMLPVCMSCGQIRNQQGAWQKLPAYLKEQADVDVTHGLCPTCLEKLYPE